MDTFLLSLIVLLSGGLVALLLCRLFSLMKVAYVALTTAGCAIGLYAIAAVLQGGTPLTFSMAWLHLFSLSFTLDSLSAFFLIPIFTVCPLAVIYSFHYMDNNERKIRVGVNYFFLTLLILSMALVTIADNIITFALVWELMSLSSFFLVMHDYHKEETRRAGYIYFIFTHVGAMFVFAAFALAYRYTGSFDLAAMNSIPGNIKIYVFLLALAGFGSKAGIFPLHIWLPHAHPAAPSNVSAIMSGVMIKMGIYGIFRIYAVLGATQIVLGEVVLLMGIITGVLGVVYAIGKGDLKKLLAYSSVENIGIILIGMGVGMIGISSGNAVMAGFGFAGSLLHVLNHSFFKSLLFLGAGAVLHKTGTKQIDQLGGLTKRMPATARTFMIGSISISGLPPFNGFISEFLIYYGAFNGLTLSGSAFIFTTLAILALAIIGGLAAACFTKVIGIVFLGEPRTASADNAEEAGFTMTFSMVILACTCVLVGIFPEPFIQTVFACLKNIPTLIPLEEGVISPVSANLAFAARLLLGVVLCTMVLRKIFYLKKDIDAGPTWGCGFTQGTVKIQYTGTSYSMSVVDFFRPFVQIRTNYSGIRRIFPGRTSFSTHVGDIAEATLMDRIVSPIIYLASKLRWIQHGHIQLYIGYIIVTIVVLLLFL